MENRLTKNLLVQIFSINILIFVILIGVFLGKFYPEIQQVEAKKQELEKLIESQNTIQKKWLSYTDFKQQISLYSSGSSYVSTIAKALTEDFYASKIMNSGEGDFTTYFEKKKETVEELSMSPSSDEKKEHVSNILPEYNPEMSQKEGSFSDFKFINYVEALLYAFNLETDSPIGVSDINIIEEYGEISAPNWEQIKKENPESIDANIYYIPLVLKLVWAKEDVIDFLQFSESVGTISLFKGDIKVVQNTDIKRQIPFWNKENIFENQVFDIENIVMQDYLDSEISPSNQDIISYVRSTQAKEKFIFEVKLRFFVRGLPNYVLKNSVRETITSYDTLVKTLAKRTKEVANIEAISSDIVYAINGIRSLNFDIILLDKEAKDIRTALAKNDNLRETYRKSNVLKNKIETIEKNLEKNNHILDIAKNK